MSKPFAENIRFLQNVIILQNGEICMTFHDRLNDYILQAKCSSKELAQASKLSEGTISRYRKGYRVPNVRGEHFAGLTKGLYGILSKQDPDITEEEISESLKKLIDKSYGIDYDTFIEKLKLLLRGFEISNNELGRRLNYDPSYISRILSGQRRPADIRKFNANVAYYIAHQKADELEPSRICEVLGCDGRVVEDRDRLQEEVENWLSS